jgi:hypothetical protein
MVNEKGAAVQHGEIRRKPSEKLEPGEVDRVAERHALA